MPWQEGEGGLEPGMEQGGQVEMNQAWVLPEPGLVQKRMERFHWFELHWKWMVGLPW